MGNNLNLNKSIYLKESLLHFYRDKLSRILMDIDNIIDDKYADDTDIEKLVKASNSICDTKILSEPLITYLFTDGDKPTDFTLLEIVNDCSGKNLDKIKKIYIPDMKRTSLEVTDDYISKRNLSGVLYAEEPSDSDSWVNENYGFFFGEHFYQIVFGLPHISVKPLLCDKESCMGNEMFINVNTNLEKCIQAMYEDDFLLLRIKPIIVPCEKPYSWSVLDTTKEKDYITKVSDSFMERFLNYLKHDPSQIGYYLKDSE